MILVDSSVWIDYFRGAITPETEKLDSLLGNEALAIGDLILAEVLQGFSSEREFNQAVKLLTSLTVIESGYDLLHSDRDFDPFAEHLRLRVAV